MDPFAAVAGGQVLNPNDSSNCQYCSLTEADQYLSSVSITYGTRWRDYGIGFAFIFFNIAAAVLFYYLFRVQRGSGFKRIGASAGKVFAMVRKDPASKKTGKAKANTAQDKVAPEESAI